MTSRPPALSRAPFLALSVCLVLLVAACGTSTPTAAPSGTPTPTPTVAPSASAAPSPSGSPDDAAVAAAIERDVQRLRGLAATRPVEPRLIDEAGVRAYIDKSLADIPAARIEASGALLQALGLLPAGTSLGDEFTKLFTTQVAGFYEPETKELYVVARKGGFGPLEQMTFAHEYTHALQDQHFPQVGGDEFEGALSGIIRASDGNSDRSLGALGLIEGDPTLVMTLWVQEHLTLTELLDIAAAATDPETLQILADMPAILRETLMFPYSAGGQLVLDRQASGGWAAVDALYADPPASTEQLLHPQKYPSDEPVAVDLPADLAARMGAGWTSVLEDTIGELQLRVWLEGAGGDARKSTAIAAAAGWGGDRVELLEGRNGAWALILKTTWDSEGDAAEFTTTAQATIRALGLRGDVLPGEGDTNASVVLASDPASLQLLANVLGLAG